MVLLFGRAEDERLKGLDIAAAGFSQAARRVRDLPGIELVIRGARKGTAAEVTRRVRKQARDKGLNVRVKQYTTQPARLADDLRAASLVIMPSRAEGFGLVGAEAIVAGTPVLVSSTSGLGTLLTEALDQESLRTVVETTSDDKATAENWGRAIEAVLKNRTTAFQQARALQQQLAETITWASAISAFLKALDPSTALAHKDSPPTPSPPTDPQSLVQNGSDVIDRGLPQRLRGFTGRGELLSKVEQALSETPPSPVALYGPGGVGKSSVAVEYAYRFADRYDLVQFVNAETPELIAAQIGELGVAIGVASATVDTDTAAKATIEALQHRQNWLLVFDNIVHPDDLQPWLPKGSGHVLATSRAGGWQELAHPIPVEEFHRAESIDLLTRNVQGLDAQDAGQVADILGDLPLALAQVSGVLGAGVSPAELRTLISEQAKKVLDHGAKRSYGETLAAITLVATTKLADESPTAANLLQLCCYLAPEPIPADWFRALPASHTATTAPGPLPQGVLDTSAAFSLIRDKGLGRLDASGMRLHRLTQAIIRDHTRHQTDAYQTLAADILTTAAPLDSGDTTYWPQWKRLTPHLLATNLYTTSSPPLRQVACKAAHYLIVSGQTKAAHTLTTSLHQGWAEHLGADHTDTLTAAQHRTHALRDLGDYTTAHIISQATLRHHRQTLGEDHPDTLTSANNLAVTLSALGRDNEALPLDKDAHERRRRVLGEDHPDTLTSAGNLAGTLRALGRANEALPFAQDTYERCRRVLGDDHPGTLNSAGNLAGTLRALGRDNQALPLAQDTHERRRRVLGDDHPDTLTSASNLAGTLRALGRANEALPFAQDTYERCRRVLGDDHPGTLTSANNLAALLRALGRANEALPFAQDTYERCRRILGDDHPDTLTSANNLAAILSALGRANEALPLDKDAHERCRRILGEDHPDTLTSANNLAGTLSALGRDNQALPLAQDTHERRRRILGDDHPDTLNSANNLAVLLRALGRDNQALPLAQDAHERCRRILGDDHPDTLTSANNLAGTLRALGRDNQALPLAQDTYERRRRILGDDHLDTLTSARNLVIILSESGRGNAARVIEMQIPKKGKQKRKGGRGKNK
ncbi:D-inositol-3-phosphate glycosyltransferase [Actinomadura sp. RB68]|uniref:D-inositol-3-phosphate glycosyltransferase n=2 Tax=Actinomadura macrotermitis TaxID=2585200 RepID=A0A7K0BZB1_9ACTN|nr:D-inositol-3-phosphate glycosyltransferase [Actinomadura macrotermitis]